MDQPLKFCSTVLSNTIYLPMDLPVCDCNVFIPTFVTEFILKRPCVAPHSLAQSFQYVHASHIRYPKNQVHIQVQLSKIIVSYIFHEWWF